jgi:hypothetical protein
MSQTRADGAERPAGCDEQITFEFTSSNIVRRLRFVDGDEMVTGSDTGDDEAETGTRRSAQGHRHAAWRQKLHQERIEKKNQEEEE